MHENVDNNYYEHAISTGQTLPGHKKTQAGKYQIPQCKLYIHVHTSTTALFRNV